MKLVNSASQDIEGFVEAIIDDTIHGWVNVDPQKFSLCAVLDGFIIGSAEEFHCRADLSEKPLAKGYSITCLKHVTPADLTGGRLQVVAMNSHAIFPLPVWHPLSEAGTFLNIDVADLKKAWDSVPIDSRKMFTQELGIPGGREFGRISSDGVVQAGRNGYLFLLAGRNELAKFYTGEVEIDVNAWIACFLQRHQSLTELRIRYLQLVIPEKSSIYYEYAPFTAVAGSEPYREMIGLGMEKKIPICDVLPSLLAAKDDRAVYLQGDTHLSTFGAEIVVKKLLDSLGETVSYPAPGIMKLLRVGDLAERYADDGDIQELVSMYGSLSFNGIEGDIELLASIDPDTGHQGRRRVWRNDLAPIKKKVVCFGGSSFERGEHSGHLSWWCSRLFSEFHFTWSPDLDIDYVNSISPDIVICQSIERFLTEVPSR